MQRHAGLSCSRADLADELALQRLVVELALAGHDGARRLHPLVEVERVEHERRARLERRAVRGPQSAGQAAGGAGHRDAARVLRELLRELVEPLLEPLDHLLRRPPSAGRRPSARPRTWCGRRSARRSSPCRCRLRPRSPRSAPAPPSLVAEPPTATRITCAPACAAAAISSPVPYVVAAHASRSSSDHQPEPGRPSPSPRSPSRRPRPGRTRSAPGSPSGPFTVTAISSPPSCGSSASSVPSPPSATGHRSGGINPAFSSPRPIAPATWAALNVPLNESGATEHRTLGIGMPHNIKGAWPL